MDFLPIDVKMLHNNDGTLLMSWAAWNNAGGALQSAFRLCVGSTYDSGWTDTDIQNHCFSVTAAPGETLRYALTLRDDIGNESDTATGEFLYCHAPDWAPKWIACPDDEESRPAYFRREFTAPEKPTSAVLFACGIGLQKLYINGSTVGDAVLAPPVSDFTKRCYYTVNDVTELVNTGANCAGAIVADGWRRNYGQFLKGNVEHVDFYGIPMLAYMLVLKYADGHTETVDSGADWTAAHGATVYAHLFNGEKYDARLEKHDWNTAGGGAGFVNACVMQTPTQALTFSSLMPIREQKTYEPVSITMVKGRWILDFGQNVAGYLRVKLPAMAPGTHVILRHTEELDEDDTLFRDGLRAALAEDTFISDGKPAVWSPSFTYHGFRFASVEGWPGRLTRDDVCAVLISNDIKSKSRFDSGSTMLNAIHNAAVATETDNLHGIATDCPQRDERMGWMNDATVRFVETPYNFDVSALFPKIVRDIMDEQGTDGATTCTAPFVYGNRPADPVSSSFLVAGLENYLHTGDASLLSRAYDAMKAWNDYLETHSDNGIVNFSYYGDWAGPQGACVGDTPCSAVTPGILMSTGYHFMNSRILAYFARILGKADEAQRHQKDAERIRAAFLEKWYDDSTGNIAEGSQGALAFALKLELVPEESVARTAALMNKALADNDYTLTTGNLTTVYLIEMLADNGYIDSAYRVMTDERYPSYGFMFQNCATTVWERFELKKDGGMNSHNHPMYGSVDSWLYSRIAGVRPMGEGFRRMLIKPVMPQGLLYASAVVDCPRGQIYVKWHKKYGKTYLAVQIPFGTEAEVQFDGKTHRIHAGFYTFIAQ